MPHSTEAHQINRDPRHLVIWSTNAWVGMALDVSAEARGQIFEIAIRDLLPDVAAAEIAYALGIVEGARG